MQWYEDQAYVSWQRRDGSLTVYIDDAIDYARDEFERRKGASEGKKPKRVLAEVASAAVQLNSEYAAWSASMLVERERCALYMDTIIAFCIGSEAEDDEENERLRMAANVGKRFVAGIRSGEHFTNVWNETPLPSVEEDEIEAGDAGDEGVDEG